MSYLHTYSKCFVFNFIVIDRIWSYQYDSDCSVLMCYSVNEESWMKILKKTQNNIVSLLQVHFAKKNMSTPNVVFSYQIPKNS